MEKLWTTFSCSSPNENIYTRNITQTEWVIFRNIYVCINIQKTVKREVLQVKESGDEYMRGFGERKWKGDMCDIIIMRVYIIISKIKGRTNK